MGFFLKGNNNLQYGSVIANLKNANPYGKLNLLQLPDDLWKERKLQLKYPTVSIIYRNCM